LYRILCSYWLPHFFAEKIRQTTALFWFRLRDVGILQIFYSQAVIQRIIVDSPAFFETGLAEKIGVCAHTTRLLMKYTVKKVNDFPIPVINQTLPGRE
jgi:hypothetical protein